MAFPSDRAISQPEVLAASPLAGAALVRLPREFEITPTRLNVYRECPRKFRLTYIDKLRTPWRYEEQFVLGRAVHTLLADAARRLRVKAPILSRDALKVRAYELVPRDQYPGADAYDSAIRKVVLGVETGVRYLMLDPDSAIILYETERKRPYVLGDRRRLSFRVDLARWTADAEGEFVEIIDYKTGKRRDDDELPVFARFVINPFLANRERCEPWDVRVRFTYVWLDVGEVTMMELDSERCWRPWRTVSMRIEELFAETVWAPRPSGLCKWCPFYRIACDGTDADTRPSPGLIFEDQGDGR